MYGSITATTSSSSNMSSKTKGSMSIASGVVNLSNTIIGAGMLGLPGAFQGTGWLSGLILLLLSATLSAHGLVLLSKAACITERPCSFYTVAKASVPRYTILIDLAVSLKCFGVASGYLITISDSMVNALDHILLTGDAKKDDRMIISILLSRPFWVVGALLLVLPFSFYRTLDELKKASSLALVFVFLLVGMIIAYANDVADPCAGYDDSDETTCRGEIESYTNFALTMSRVPIFVFAFTCQQNIFPIVNEIELLSQRRINIVICCSIGFALMIFATVALEGYSTYGSFVRGDILLNYPENKQVTFLRICIAFMLALHYPLQLDPSRRCITSLVKVIIKWWTRHQQSTEDEIEMGQDQDEVIHHDKKGSNEESIYYEMTQSPVKEEQVDGDKEDKLFYGITSVFLLLSFMLAMAVDDLGIVLALVGATGSTLVSYVLPGLIYIKIYPHNDTSKILSYIQLLLGIVIIPLALYFILTNREVSH